MSFFSLLPPLSNSILKDFGLLRPKSKEQVKLFTSRKDGYGWTNAELGLGRFPNICRLGLLVGLAFSK